VRKIPRHHWAKKSIEKLGKSLVKNPSCQIELKLPFICRILMKVIRNNWNICKPTLSRWKSILEKSNSKLVFWARTAQQTLVEIVSKILILKQFTCLKKMLSRNADSKVKIKDSYFYEKLISIRLFETQTPTDLAQNSILCINED